MNGAGGWEAHAPYVRACVHVCLQHMITTNKRMRRPALVPVRAGRAAHAQERGAGGARRTRRTCGHVCMFICSM